METFFARMIGKLLGDGTIIKKEGRRPRFQFMHRVEDFEWTHYCYEQLRHYIPLSEPTYERAKDNRSPKGYSERYTVQSFTHEQVNQLYDIWYPNKMKAVPLTHLERYFTAESLAWWYQDDGHLKKNKEGVVEKLVLSTECWTDEERELLKYILNLKFNLLFSIDGQKRLLLYDQLQINYFLQLVEPWMQPIMIRKMKTALPYKTIAKRTTLTVTSNFQFERPTKELNETIAHYIDDVELNAQHFQKWNYARRERNEMKSYQITLTDDNRQKLAQVQAKTGLTLNEITQHCLSERLTEHFEPKELQQLDQFTTTQKNIVLGSIMGDGMLRYNEHKSGSSSSYYEHYGIKQKKYREWKVLKLAPLWKIAPKSNSLLSRVAPLWKELESHFYQHQSNNQRTKRIPSLFFDEAKQLESVATLFLDDGSLLISHRVNHRSNTVFLTPHIALYLQNFTKQELERLSDWFTKRTDVPFRLTKRPDGHGYYLRTSQTAHTLQFLKCLSPITDTCPSMAYKSNWSYRFAKEREKWQAKHPHYRVVTSSRERMRPYTEEEIETIITMKRNGETDQSIADQLGRTYWAIVYKVSELRKSHIL